jgi:2-dehydropantoate 2-reductase
VGEGIKTRVAIMGAGAIGSLFGSLLAEAGNEVYLIGRASLMEAVRQRGLWLRGITAKHVLSLHAEDSPQNLRSQAFDVVFLTVKAYDTQEACSQLKPILDGGTPVLCLQNGIGVEEKAAKALGRRSLLRGVTFCGAFLEAPGSVRFTGRGETVLGLPFKETDGRLLEKAWLAAEALNAAGLPARVEKKIEGAVWMKTLINAGINPYGALTGLRNGELLEVGEMGELMAETVEEGTRVACRLGVALPGDPVEEMFRTVKATAGNFNSMLQDVRRGKPTEIDYLNGAVAKLGFKASVPAPLNRLLTVLVKSLERRGKPTC